MRYLKLSEVIELHSLIIVQTGGSEGLRNLSGLEFAISNPRTTFAGSDLYPTIEEKAAILCYSVIQNHPFVDGNKRVGHACMEVFLVLNGYEIESTIDEQERIVLGVASSKISKSELVAWIKTHIRKR